MDQPLIEFSRVAGFMRQHTHDVRNHLNGLDLEAALLTEIVTDEEAREGVSRMREQIRQLAGELRTLSSKLGPPEPRSAPIKANELFLIWQDQATEIGLKCVEWENRFGDEEIKVDPAGVAEVFKELLVNARHFSGGEGLKARGEIAGNVARFQLQESKPSAVDPTGWGEKPFFSTKRSGYGLGLWVVEQNVKANRGAVRREFVEPNQLLTTILFPLEKPLEK